MQFAFNIGPFRAFLTVRPLAMLAFIVVCGIGVAACVGYTKGPKHTQVKADRGIKFNHSMHTADQGLECSTCHDFESDDRVHMSSAKHDVCGTCHEIPEDLTAEPAKCAYCHTKEDYAILPRVPSLDPERKFDHGKHADKEVKCESCHTNVKTDFVMADSLKPMCMDCHGKTDPKLNECSTCHNELSAATIPITRAGMRIQHDAPQIWEKVHGKESKVDPKYCAMCHDVEASCDACHRTQAPDNHTLSWRQETHGLQAGWDRNSCNACHEEESCMKCHQNTEPKSHRGGWSGPTNTHCVSCHFPAQRTECIVCHEDIDHEKALPSPHALGFFPANCALCHPGGLPNRAPHLMNSTVRCVVCHK
jgi:hypothetical protein